MGYILAIDEGTTATTVLLLSSSLEVIEKASEEITQFYPEKGWVEHDPEEIYDKTMKAVETVIEKSRIEKEKIECIGITNQRETVVAWNRKTGKPYGKAIVWQCRRTEKMCESLKKRGLEKLIMDKTGLVIDPYFSATKIAWLLKNGVSSKEDVAFGTIDSWLLFKLTGGTVHGTDVSNASRTMLFNIKSLKWDDDLLKLFGIKKSSLPEVFPSAGILGKTKNAHPLPDGIPISGIAGDQQAALFGQCCFKEGDSKCTYGTGAFLLMNTGRKPVKSKHRLLTTVAWKIKENVTYALEGSSFIAGAVVQWLRDGLKIISSSSEIEKVAGETSGGVIFVPAFVGLGAPHWRSSARGVIWGITRDTTREHIARAALEGIAFQVAELLESMEKDLGKKTKTMKVDGGASVNNVLMQFQADITGKRIIRPKVLETTALGAGMLAGLGIGVFSSLDALANAWVFEREFIPGMGEKERKKRLALWKEVVKKA